LPTLSNGVASPVALMFEPFGVYRIRYSMVLVNATSERHDG
jgi:hypothetical protein